MEQMSVRIALVLLAAAFLASTSTMVAVSARYLPTRSQEDRLERLRELLKDLFDSDYEHNNNRAYSLPEIPVIPERAAIFKRSVGAASSYPSAGMDDHESAKGMISRIVSGGALGSVVSSGNGMAQLPAAAAYGNPERKVMK